jgi:parallel beta-helix repeat protein
MPLRVRQERPGVRTPASPFRTSRVRLSLLPLEDRVVPSTLFVDDDRQQYPAARYTSIQAAVRAARAGDTIQVYPGLYNEVVTVDKAGLKLFGDQVNYLNRRGDTTTEVVVTGVTPAGRPSPLGVINLRANGVVLQGFTVQGNTNGPGVFTDPAYSGYRIEGNLMWNNNPPAGDTNPYAPSGGLHLNSSGVTQTVVRGNAIKNHTPESYGDGIYTELTVSNALIDGNYFQGNVHYSVDFAGAASDPGYPGFKKFYPRSSDVTITNNTVDGSGGFLIQYADRIAVSNNMISYATRTGIYVGGDVNGVTVSGNNLNGAADVNNAYYVGRHTGIFVGTLDIPGPIQGVVVSGNSITGYRNGIWLAGDAATGAVSGVTVENNTVQDSNDPNGTSNPDPYGYGILLWDANNNTIRNNQVSSSEFDGIHVDANSTGNLITMNSMHGSGGYDAFDESLVPVNMWIANDFGTANRAYIT